MKTIAVFEYWTETEMRGAGGEGGHVIKACHDDDTVHSSPLYSYNDPLFLRRARALEHTKEMTLR